MTTSGASNVRLRALLSVAVHLVVTIARGRHSCRSIVVGVDASTFLHHGSVSSLRRSPVTKTHRQDGLPSQRLWSVEEVEYETIGFPLPRRRRRQPKQLHYLWHHSDVIWSSNARNRPSRASGASSTSLASTRGNAGLSTKQKLVLSPLHVLEEIGSGSYGTVHRLVVPAVGTNGDADDLTNGVTANFLAEYVGKRAWDRNDLARLLLPSPGKTRMEVQDGNEAIQNGKVTTNLQVSSDSAKVDEAYLKERETRCQAYFDVEVHCFTKLPPHPCLPKFYGVHKDVTMESASPFGNNKNDKRGWMLFEPIKDSSGTLARTLQSWINQEQRDRKQESRILDDDIAARLTSLDPYLDPSRRFDHHLSCLSLALGFSSGASLTAVLDAIMRDLLVGLAHIHSNGIVHRDIKPANLLVVDPESRPWNAETAVASGSDEMPSATGSGRLVLIDFGSAADLTTFGVLKSNVGISERVAVSPVYSAPEVFVDASCLSEACTFDCFSAGLLFCQILFQLYDERSDAGFRQQLHATNYDMNAWLQAVLQAKVTPTGLDQALEVLQERPGLWSLLQKLLHRQPRRRVTSMDAVDELEKIQSLQITDPLVDGAFLRDVLESMETCDVEDLIDDAFFASLTSSSSSPTSSRSLHYVATFERARPLGLVLSEALEVDGDESGDVDEMSATDRQLWKSATASARPGEVFVKGIVEGGQAEALGIIEVGDRLQGVGELPVGRGGFEKAVAMIQDQPRASQYVTLQFDRRSNFPASLVIPSAPVTDAPSVRVVDQGGWSSQGHRQAQEDAFILHLVQDIECQRTIVLAGVCDGHLGRAASSFVRDKFPDAFSQELAMQPNEAVSIENVLEAAWNQVCDDYTFECRQESCTAEYDPREGVLLANTGSADDVAGTTATLLAMDLQSSSLALLNCGDSRAVVVRPDSTVVFQTADHSPGEELQRFILGREQGLNYTSPICVMSRWVVRVGQYTYGVSRSLEGSYATSKGIISTPDVTEVPTERGMSVVVATDGLWEVIDSEEAGKIVNHVRYNQGMSAGDAAKTLCSLALEKGSKDNVSVVVVFLET